MHSHSLPTAKVEGNGAQLHHHHTHICFSRHYRRLANRHASSVRGECTAIPAPTAKVEGNGAQLHHHHTHICFSRHYRRLANRHASSVRGECTAIPSQPQRSREMAHNCITITHIYAFPDITADWQTDTLAVYVENAQPFPPRPQRSREMAHNCITITHIYAFP